MRNRLVLLTGTAAALPVIVSTVRALSDGWVPTGDAAIIAVRAYDVFTTHPPLVGPFSTSTLLIGHPVQSPGPLLFWLMAVPVRLGAAVPALWMGIVNTAAVMGSVALARRRGGLPLMFATAIGLALACGSLDASVLHDLWGPSSTLLPFALLVFLCWSLACGEYRLMPLTALVASYVVQSHLTYAMPVFFLVAIGLGGFVASRTRLPRQWLIATLALLALCWALPLAEEVVHRPGNIERIVQAATAGERTYGPAGGFHSVTRAVGVPPWWLRHPLAPFARVTEVLNGPGAFTTVTAVAVLVLLLAAAVFGRRRGVTVPALLALGLMAALFAVTATTPSGPPLFLTISYTIWWASFAGMFAWLVLFHAAVVLLEARIPRLAFPWRYAGASAAAVAGVVVAAGLGPDQLRGAYRPAGSIADRVIAVVPHPEKVFVRGDTSDLAFDLQGTLAYRLRDEGIAFVVDSLPGIGTRYDPAQHPHTTTLTVSGTPPGAHERLVTRATFGNVPSNGPPRRHTYYVTLARR